LKRLWTETSFRLSVAAATLITLASWIMASTWPLGRLWGISFWWLTPGALWVVVVALALTAAVAWNWALRTPKAISELPSGEGRGWLWAGIGSAVALGLGYWFLRAHTHFLGDGYLLLEEFATNQPRLRLQNYGEMWLHAALRNAWPGAGPEAALASFRCVSVAAGFLHSLLALFVGIRLWGRTNKAFLFAIGMMTGGYALMHFGYVENYALFGLLVSAFCYFGVLVSRGRMAVPWVLVAALLATFMHALGLCLIPVACVLWLSKSGAWTWLGAKSLRVKVALLLVATLPLVALVLLACERSWFLRLALVPLATSPFCLDGYSLFSGSHLLDLANLLVLLVPSLGVLLVLQFQPGLLPPTRDRSLLFLWFVFAATLACAFVFEAKLGMPRDWDLFSFVGIPLLAMLLYRVLQGPLSRLSVAGVIVAVAMNVACLFDRACIQHIPELGIQLFKQYADLDLHKNRHGWYLLEQYYEQRGDAAKDLVREARLARFPEDETLKQAWLLLKRSNLEESRTLTRTALAANPWNADAWLNLGRIHLASGQPESALVVLEIADAFSPGSSPIQGELGLACFTAGDFRHAEKWLLASWEADTSGLQPIMALARFYQARGEWQHYEQWLSRAAFRPEAAGTWARELGDLCLKQSDPAGAARAYREALKKGTDSAAIRQTLLIHSELQPYFTR
jgi:hypothetical protein